MAASLMALGISDLVAGKKATEASAKMNTILEGGDFLRRRERVGLVCATVGGADGVPPDAWLADMIKWPVAHRRVSAAPDRPGCDRWPVAHRGVSAAPDRPSPTKNTI